MRKITELERENTSLKLKLDETNQNCKKEIANLKLDVVRERGIKNKSIEVLNNEIEGNKFFLNLNLIFHIQSKYRFVV